MFGWLNPPYGYEVIEEKGVVLGWDVELSDSAGTPKGTIPFFGGTQPY